MSKVLVIDPPSGWRYGFPKPYPLKDIHNDEELTTWLSEQGYPKDLIPLALRHSRFWEADVSE